MTPSADEDPLPSSERESALDDDPEAFPRDHAIALVKRLPAYARLAWALSRDPRLPPARRVAILGGLAYLVSPIDAIPGLIPLIGQVDDVLVVLLTLRFALRGLPPDVQRGHLEAVGLSQEATDEDVAVLSAMGAWALRKGGRLGLRASLAVLDVGSRLASRAGRRGQAVGARLGSSASDRVASSLRRSGRSAAR